MIHRAFVDVRTRQRAYAPDRESLTARNTTRSSSRPGADGAVLPDREDLGARDKHVQSGGVDGGGRAVDAQLVDERAAGDGRAAHDADAAGGAAADEEPAAADHAGRVKIFRGVGRDHLP